MPCSDAGSPRPARAAGERGRRGRARRAPEVRGAAPPWRRDAVAMGTPGVVPDGCREAAGGKRGRKEGESRPGPAPGPRGVGSAPRPAASQSESGGGGGAAASGYVGAPERADPEAAVRLWSSAPGPGPRPGPAGCFPRSRTGTCGNPRRRCWTPARTHSPDSSTSASLSVRRPGGRRERVSGAAGPGVGKTGNSGLAAGRWGRRRTRGSAPARKPTRRAGEDLCPAWRARLQQCAGGCRTPQNASLGAFVLRHGPFHLKVELLWELCREAKKWCSSHMNCAVEYTKC